MPELPSGTLTVHLGDRYPEVLATHCALVRAALAAHEGHEVDTQGDSFEFITIKPLAATESSAPGSCVGHSRVPSPDRGRPPSTDGCGL
jgi:hypothetical protein